MLLPRNETAIKRVVYSVKKKILEEKPRKMDAYK